MNAAFFDTHAMVKQLVSAGFIASQAEAVTDIVRQRQEADLSHVSTKADLGEAKAKAEIIKWMFGTIGFQTLIILGAVITLARITHL